MAGVGPSKYQQRLSLSSYFLCFETTFGIRAVGMELQECVDKLEQKFDAIATSQKERRCHITERLEKMTEQLSSKSTPEMGENSAPGTQQFQKKSA